MNRGVLFALAALLGALIVAAKAYPAFIFIVIAALYYGVEDKVNES